MLVVAASLQRRRALWTSRVRGWFVQAEAQFATKGVKVSLIKYFYVIQALRQRTINRIPVLLILPVEDPYQALKDKLVEMYNLLDYQRAELLMALPFVLPSELMDCMKALMPPEEQARPSILFARFRVRLPSDIQVCLQCCRPGLLLCCPRFPVRIKKF